MMMMALSRISLQTVPVVTTTPSPTSDDTDECSFTQRRVMELIRHRSQA
jgi:hypothetical protein